MTANPPDHTGPDDIADPAGTDHLDDIGGVHGGRAEQDGDPHGPVGRFALLSDDVDEPVTLFPGDTSILTYEQRHTLNVVLKTPFLSAASHPTLWRTLLEDPAAIESRLHDLFLHLEIDRDREIALKRPVANPTGDRFPTLFYDTRLSREETVVVVFLRSHYRTERGSGDDRVFVDAADIHDFAEHLRPPSATDVAGDRRRVANAIEQIRKSGILTKTREEDRFEVSPAIELLLPLSKLTEILADLQRHNGTDAQDAPDAGADTATTDPGQLMLEDMR